MPETWGRDALTGCAAIARFERIDDLDAVAVSFLRGATPAEIETTVDVLAP